MRICITYDSVRLVKAMANKKKDQTLIRATVSVDPDDYQTMEKLAAECGLSTARLIRQAMRDFIERRMHDKKISISLPQKTNKGRK